MHSIIIDILNEEALEVVNKLEQQGLIKIRHTSIKAKPAGKRKLIDYLGALKCEDSAKLDQQLDELRNGW